jgi:hypothetical protein
MEVDRPPSLFLQIFRMGNAIDEWAEPALVDREDNFDQVFLLGGVGYGTGRNWVVSGIAAELLDYGSRRIVAAPYIARPRVRCFQPSIERSEIDVERLGRQPIGL